MSGYKGFLIYFQKALDEAGDYYRLKSRLLDIALDYEFRKGEVDCSDPFDILDFLESKLAEHVPKRQRDNEV